MVTSEWVGERISLKVRRHTVTKNGGVSLYLVSIEGKPNFGESTTPLWYMERTKHPLPTLQFS